MLKTKGFVERGPNGNIVRHGPSHHAWKGDKAKVASGRYRARSMYELGDCEKCGNPATDRHHKDGNTLNNKPRNIIPLCRRCHMIEDGRLARLRLVPHYTTDPSPCSICSKLSKPLRRGRCHRCNEFLRRNGVEWTKEGADNTGRRTPDRPCGNCGRMWGIGWCKGRCPACRLYLTYHGVERPAHLFAKQKTTV